ncbi:MFS transporter [Bacillus sp. FJAT-45350]|uniref:MFS transporter n=1 Tax=Bacillus sp. FJAT-45350 TaxID=2011014 RepID=UPI00211BF7A0|nr:MFS transporter [Bacillus sp. FJAT-45350]
MSVAQFLAMQIWFNFSAVMPVIEQEWGLTPTQSGIIIAFFHVGYVIAILFYSFLIDKYNPKYSFVFGALVAGIAGIIFALFAQGFWSTLILRMISGIGIAGIYVPGMRILSGLFPPKERGKALGVYVGSLVVGSGFSLFVSGLFIEFIGWQGVILLTSSFCIIAAILMYTLSIPTVKSTGQNLALQWQTFKKVFRKPNLLVNGGYAGHCWELYAMWAWIGPFLVYYFTVQGFAQSDAIRFGNMAGALVIMIGGIATYIGGRLSDHIGRIKAINLFLVISILCSLFIGWLTTLPLIVMLTLASIYGFTIVADSPIYNVSITEVADPEVLGLALGVQSVLGFSVTIFSPIIFGIVLESFSWGMAFTVIGIGTILAPICMLLLSKIQHQTNLLRGSK